LRTKDKSLTQGQAHRVSDRLKLTTKQPRRTLQKEAAME
jgi:hypothetical protein